MAGYTFALGPVEYAAHKDGTPLTLVECWREVEGVGGATIYRPDGTVLLTNAGSLTARHVFLTRARRARAERAYAAAVARLAAMRDDAASVARAVAARTAAQVVAA